MAGREKVEYLILTEGRHMHRRADRPSVDKDRQRGEHLLLRLVEQPDAPFDRGPQRALALRKIDRPGSQRLVLSSKGLQLVPHTLAGPLFPPPDKGD